MNFFNYNLKTKHKLMIVSLLPFFILSIFVIYIIEFALPYHYWAKMDQQIVRTLSVGSHLSSNLINEQLISFEYLNDTTNSNNFKTELNIARESTEQELGQFIKEINLTGAFYKEKNATFFLTPFLETFDDLKEFQYKIDGKIINSDQMIDFYKNLHSRLINTLEQTAHDINYIAFFHPIINVLLLLKEQYAATLEKYLFSENAVLDQFSRDKFAQLYSVVGEQSAYRKMYYLIGTNEDDKLLNSIAKSNSFYQADQIKNKFLESPTTSIDLENWQNLQNEKIFAYNEISQKILDKMIVKAEKSSGQIKNKFIYLITSMIVSLILAFLFIYLGIKKLTNNLQREVNILSDTGNQILSSLTEASAGTAETATNVAETTSTIEELRQTAEIANKSAENISDISKSNLTTLLEVETNLKQNMEGMNGIKDGMQSISKSIVQLSEQALTIRKIIDSVDNLAEQSHLLAINAAIEAAKAKEHGKGFNVVAQEIRNLAEQSKQATIQVRGILNDIKNSTNSAVMATEQGTKAVNFGMEFSQTMNETIKNLSKNIVNAANVTSQITQNSDQQLTGINQVTLSMINIKEASSQHVTQINEIENSIQRVNDTTKNLISLILELKI